MCIFIMYLIIKVKPVKCFINVTVHARLGKLTDALLVFSKILLFCEENYRIITIIILE